MTSSWSCPLLNHLSCRSSSWLSLCHVCGLPQEASTLGSLGWRAHEEHSLFACVISLSQLFYHQKKRLSQVLRHFCRNKRWAEFWAKFLCLGCLRAWACQSNRQSSNWVSGHRAASSGYLTGYEGFYHKSRHIPVYPPTSYPTGIHCEGKERWGAQQRYKTE